MKLYGILGLIIALGTWFLLFNILEMPFILGLKVVGLIFGVIISVTLIMAALED